MGQLILFVVMSFWLVPLGLGIWWGWKSEREVVKLPPVRGGEKELEKVRLALRVLYPEHYKANGELRTGMVD